MSAAPRLDALVSRAAARTPDALAVRAPDGVATYAALDRLADAYARALRGLGVREGDRVGVWLPKGLRAVAAMQGALRLGAAYVPVDVASPWARVRAVLESAAPRAVVVAEMGHPSWNEDVGPVARLVASDVQASEGPCADDLPAVTSDPDALAYILYTSGSTGAPKGVRLSHRNALSFVAWAVEACALVASDRVANHAPFHFDLSVFDLYAAFAAGACVCVLPESASYAPQRLVDFAARERVTVWYSVPSALCLMLDRGGLGARDDLALRAVLFAGEPFPLNALRRLRAALPAARLWNLYGPTETNVCTAYEVRDLPDAWAEIPIGRAVCGDAVTARRDDGAEAAPGEEGELWVTGPTVMLGYQGRAPLGADGYATGDIVRRLDADTYAYVGRRDQMVKLRGHRIELGEVERALAGHPAVAACAVAVRGAGLDAALAAAVVLAPGREAPALLELKRHLAERVPRAMIIDTARVVGALPRTGNGKLDRAALKRLLESDGETQGETSHDRR
ncbi:MAG: amino acid adenylation domain-containing protein [Polyangiales bacterium]